jgi:uncharacterized protein (DUF2147 family)
VPSAWTHKPPPPFSLGRLAGAEPALPLLLTALCLLAVPSVRSAESPATAAGPAATDVQAQQVLGNWLTQDRDGIIEISVAPDRSYQGRIVGGNDPGRVDTTNPDPALLTERLKGHVIMQGMRYTGDGHWSTGTIRDPNNGHIYKCRMQLLAPDRLQIRGFLGVSLLGRSQVWTRYTGTSMDLPPTN